ncbi:hypothetical protein HAX54_050751 [Datura stramonium]|uniref:NB-ARC domain-containing protein n=1 Tax=Datura stramonium TaxID=4076 RepID=A0ABS8SYG9_DATST|nr:hypothetical protein [Datura stramonium]
MLGLRQKLLEISVLKRISDSSTRAHGRSGWVKEDLEFIRSFFMKVEQNCAKDLWAHILDVAYEAKDVIDSIIVRDNGLLHLIFSLPITLKRSSPSKKMSPICQKIPKNRSLNVANSPNKPVESKPLTAAKTIVGFEEETHWIIRKLTSGRDDLDVISITGMPGSEEREIPISMMTVYWRGEGLVEQTEMVKVYLDNLISSSLVICLNEIGDEPTCQLHDLVHEFCLIKSREEKLFDLISSSAPSPSSDLMPRRMTIDYDMDHFGFNNLVLLDSKKKRHSGKHLYSLAIDGDELDGRLSDLCHELWDFSTERYWFPKLDFLNELEFLEVTFIGSNSNDNEPSVGTNQLWDFRLPSSLKKLSLCEFPLAFDALSTIARLPELEELSLVDSKIQGEEWNMGEEDTFENLKCLKFYEVTLAKWEVGEESFPVLEKLELLRCCKLVEIPPSFGDIGSLKIIELRGSPQLEDSANNINLIR